MWDCKPTFLLGMVLKQSSTTWGRSFNAQLANAGWACCAADVFCYPLVMSK